MYRVDKRFLMGEEHLFTYLKHWGAETPSDIGIVAGHFMLMYDNNISKLVPMIWQDIKNESIANISKQIAGDFPVYTFSLGLRCLDLLSDNLKTKLILVVNDHLFQSSGWNSAFLQSGLNAGDLRREFYKEPFKLPPSYLRKLKVLKKDIENVFLNNYDTIHNKQGFFPKNPYFFSEQSFRNKFGRNTKTFLTNKFFYNKTKHEQSSIMFSSQETINSTVCLTEDGKCGCSGEVIQMLIYLANRNIFSILCFVPEECFIAFNQGVKAALFFIGKKMRVVVVAGSNSDFSKALAGDKDFSVLFEVFSHSLEGNQ